MMDYNMTSLKEDYEEYYMNYKAIRISKYMPKEQQARLRKLKRDLHIAMELCSYMIRKEEMQNG